MILRDHSCIPLPLSAYHTILWRFPSFFFPLSLSYVTLSNSVISCDNRDFIMALPFVDDKTISKTSWRHTPSPGPAECSFPRYSSHHWWQHRFPETPSIMSPSLPSWLPVTIPVCDVFPIYFFLSNRLLKLHLSEFSHTPMNSKNNETKLLQIILFFPSPSRSSTTYMFHINPTSLVGYM